MVLKNLVSLFISCSKQYSVTTVSLLLIAQVIFVFNVCPVSVLLKYKLFWGGGGGSESLSQRPLTD